MRSAPEAVRTHLEGEVTSLTRGVRITRTDGVVFRFTTLDEDILIDGELYIAEVPLTMSAIQSSSNLSVDTTEITIGLDDDHITESDVEARLMNEAEVEILVTNWEAPEDGYFYLLRGTVGDVTIENSLTVKLQIRGLTYALQRPIVEKYSPTCRAAFGSKRCGIVELPVKIRRPLQKVKTFDWFLVLDSFDNISLDNGSFESNLDNWTASDDAWTTDNAAATPAGDYYAVAGTPTGVQANSGKTTYIYRDIDMSSYDSDIDAGDLSVDLSAIVMRLQDNVENPAKVYVEQYDTLGKTLKRVESTPIVPDHLEWQGIGVTTNVVPGTRTIRIGLLTQIYQGLSAETAFDSVLFRAFDNETATFSNKAFYVSRVQQTGTDLGFQEKRSFPDGTFNADITNNDIGVLSWTAGADSWWQTTDSEGSITPLIGGYFLRGGDDGTSTGGKIYTLTNRLGLTSFNTTEEEVDAGSARARAALSAALLNADAAFEIELIFLDELEDPIGDPVTTGVITDSDISADEWVPQVLEADVPANTRFFDLIISAHSLPSDSDAPVAFDNATLGVFTTLSTPQSLQRPAYLDFTEPSYDFAGTTIDGEAYLKTRDLVFAYGTVSGLDNRRNFQTTDISLSPARMFGGKIHWLSGNNAGQTSFVRIWDESGEWITLYTPLRHDPQLGDKFIWSPGCDKTIQTCSGTYFNAVNFRGEPYLPGTTRVLEIIQTALEEVREPEPETGGGFFGS